MKNSNGKHLNKIREIFRYTAIFEEASDPQEGPIEIMSTLSIPMTISLR